MRRSPRRMPPRSRIRTTAGLRSTQSCIRWTRATSSSPPLIRLAPLPEDEHPDDAEHEPRHMGHEGDAAAAARGGGDGDLARAEQLHQEPEAEEEDGRQLDQLIKEDDEHRS